MQIKEDTLSRLVLKQSNFGSIIFGVVFMVIGTGAAVVANQNILTARIIGGVFVLAGLFMVLATKFITVDIDKSQGKLTFITSSVFGKKAQDILLNQLKEVSIEEYGTNSVGGNGPRNQLQYNLVFYLQDGEGVSIPLVNSGSSFSVMGLPVGGIMSTLGRNKNIVLGNKIATFIGIPFVDRRPPSIPEVIKDVVQNISNEKPLNEFSQVQNVPVSQTASPQQTPTVPPQVVQNDSILQKN